MRTIEDIKQDICDVRDAISNPNKIEKIDDMQTTKESTSDLLSILSLLQIELDNASGMTPQKPYSAMKRRGFNG